MTIKINDLVAYKSDDQYRSGIVERVNDDHTCDVYEFSSKRIKELPTVILHPVRQTNSHPEHNIYDRLMDAEKQYARAVYYKKSESEIEAAQNYVDAVNSHLAAISKLKDAISRQQRYLHQLGSSLSRNNTETLSNLITPKQIDTSEFELSLANLRRAEAELSIETVS